MARKAAERQARRRRLGRGLESLMSGMKPVQIDAGSEPRAKPESPGSAAAASDGDPAVGGLRQIQVAEIDVSPHQPRRHFDESSLDALAASIRSAGMMQPVIVRPAPGGGDGPPFQLIAGERRWRAARRLGLERIPALVRDVADRTAAEWSLIENLQREDLNAIERAEAFQRLIDEFALTHQEIADQVGLDRSSVTNHLRLLELAAEIKDAVRAGTLSLGHAKALLAIANLERRRQLATRAARQGWPVRRLEQEARSDRPGPGAKKGRGAASAHPHLADLARRLGEHLGTKVDIRPGAKKGTGRLVIEFYSFDQFEGLLERLEFNADDIPAA